MCNQCHLKCQLHCIILYARDNSCYSDVYATVYVIMHPVNGFVLVCGTYYVDILAVTSEYDSD